MITALGLPPASLFSSPSAAAIGLMTLGLVFHLSRRTRRLGGRLLVGASLVLCSLALLPIGQLLLSPLETRFAEFAADGAPVQGIILLGGAVSLHKDGASVRPQPNRAADRLFRVAGLARAYPDAKVIVSGGPRDPRTGFSEADAARRYLVELGVKPERIVAERESSNTFENATFSAALAQPHKPDRWLLVTSAFHMPRAIGTFRAAGFAVDAAPADRRAQSLDWGIWSAASNLEAVDVAAKEYLGLLAYRMRGRTTALWPKASAPALPAR